jgi:hypothetical protein
MRLTGIRTSARSHARHLTVAAGALSLTLGGWFFSAAGASADPVLCPIDIRIDLGMSTQCAQVTGIHPGSYLVLHNQANYTGGVVPGSPHYTDGQLLAVYCWTTGARDADGHGDTYWFSVDDDNGNVGMVNDWYLTTGGYAQFSPVIKHC